MNPKVKNKLESMAAPKWIDLSVIMAGWMPPVEGEMEDIESSMPSISAETIYEEVKDKLAMLDADEILKLLHMYLMDKRDIMGEDVLWD